MDTGLQIELQHLRNKRTPEKDKSAGINNTKQPGPNNKERSRDNQHGERRARTSTALKPAKTPNAKRHQGFKNKVLPSTTKTKKSIPDENTWLSTKTMVYACMG